VAIDLLDEFVGLVAALRDGGVDHAVVGALALAIHGAPRATTDIDLLVRPEGVDAALAAARARGFTLEAFPMRFSDGMELRRVSKVREGETLTLDLLLVNDSLEPVWESRHEVATDFGVVRVISREALIKMKVGAGRARDLADVERLQELDR
jgi:hypothetical protein